SGERSAGAVRNVQHKNAARCIPTHWRRRRVASAGLKIDIRRKWRRQDGIRKPDWPSHGIFGVLWNTHLWQCIVAPLNNDSDRSARNIRDWYLYVAISLQRAGESGHEYLQNPDISDVDVLPLLQKCRPVG